MHKRKPDVDDNFYVQIVARRGPALAETIALGKWVAQEQARGASLRALSARLRAEGRAGVSPTALSFAVRIYAFSLAHDLRDARNLCPTKLRILLGVDAALAGRMIAHNERNVWTTKQMELELEKREARRRARRRQPSVERGLCRLMEVLEGDDLADLSLLGALDPEKAAALWQTQARAMARLEAIGTQLATRAKVRR